MEQYKEKLTIQNRIYLLGCFSLLAFAVLAIGCELGWFSLLRPAVGDSHWHSTWYGYLFGASCGLFAFMLTGFLRNRRALKDDHKLKKLYVKSNDERALQIQILARNTAMQILLWIGLVATVIAGYFSITVSLTILACVFVCSCTSLLLVGYYSKKM